MNKEYQDELRRSRGIERERQKEVGTLLQNIGKSYTIEDKRHKENNRQNLKKQMRRDIMEQSL
jgi:L-arabinose isomerase